MDINSRDLVCGLAPDSLEASLLPQPSPSSNQAALASLPAVSEPGGQEPDLLQPNCGPGMRVRWTVVCGHCGQARPTLILPCGHHYCAGCLHSGRAVHLGSGLGEAAFAYHCRLCPESEYIPASSVLENFAAKRYLTSGVASKPASTSSPIDDEARRLALLGQAAASRHRVLSDCHDRLLPELEASLADAVGSAAARIDRCCQDYAREVENRRAELLTELATWTAALASEVESARRRLMADRGTLARLQALVRAHSALGASPAELAMLLATVEGRLDEILNRRYPLLQRNPYDCIRYVQPMSIPANAHLLMGSLACSPPLQLQQQQPVSHSVSPLLAAVGDRNNNNNGSFDNNSRMQSITGSMYNDKENMSTAAGDAACPPEKTLGLQPQRKQFYFKFKLNIAGSHQPSCLAFAPSGELIVADGPAGFVYAFCMTSGKQMYRLGVGSRRDSIGAGGGVSASQQHTERLVHPALVAVHRGSGSIVVCDTGPPTVRLLLYAFHGFRQMKQFGVESQLHAPRCLCFDVNGRVLVIDRPRLPRAAHRDRRSAGSQAFRAVLFNPGCQLLTTFFCAGLSAPTGAAVDDLYRLFVSDRCGDFGCVIVYNYAGDCLGKLSCLPGLPSRPCGVTVRHTDGAAVLVGSGRRHGSPVIAALALDCDASHGGLRAAVLQSVELALPPPVDAAASIEHFALSEAGHLALLDSASGVHVFSLA